MHVGLVFLFMLVNYADKAVVGLSSVPIMRDLGLSNTQFGTLGSAFFLLFSLSGIVVGFAANHFRAVYGAGRHRRAPTNFGEPARHSPYQLHDARTADDAAGRDRP